MKPSAGCDWQLSTIHTGVRDIFWGLIRTPPEKRDMAAITKTADDTGKLWARLDEKLAGKLYVAGRHFTDGRYPCGLLGPLWYALPIERPELTNVRAWYERLEGCDQPTRNTSWCC